MSDTNHRSTTASDRSPYALVTGCTNGIGAELTKKLLAAGFEVYGIGLHFEGSELVRYLATREGQLANAHFHRIIYDLTDLTGLSGHPKLQELKHKLTLLVNNAGCAYYGPHQDLSEQAIHEMIAVNLEAPLQLTNLFLRTLQETKGMILNISSVTATHAAPFGACYGATKAGLSAFSKSLFEEVRKSGVRVLTLQPDLTDTNLYRNADFSCSEDSYERLDTEEVAEAAMQMISVRDGLVVTEVTLRPQRNRIVRKE